MCPRSWEPIRWSNRLDSIALAVTPLTQSDEAASADRQATTINSHRESHLIVDDSLSVRRVVSRTIERHDWVAVLARDGVEALELLEQGQVEVILTDIEMPRMDGFELISAIRNRPELNEIPIVVLTSRSSDKHRERAIGLGANEYLVKPFQERELLDVIDAAREAHSKV